MSALADDEPYTGARETATAVFVRRVKPGREHEYERLAAEMMAVSEQFEGQLASTLLHEAGAPSYTLVYSFTDQGSLRRFVDSPARLQISAEADEFSERHERIPEPTGLETWFALPGRPTMKPPPRWKMWLTSLIALYPLVVGFQEWLAPPLRRVPLLLRSAILPLILLTLMTYFVMPVVTRLVRSWLETR
jgi:antibiotic biosynthesis monooxygenase (ABM) superfamily enzyme